MEQFPHLKFVEKVIGKPRFHGNLNKNVQSENNRQNRQYHSGQLSLKTANIKANWANSFLEREKANLAPLEEDIIPVFLQMNPDLLNSVEFSLENFQIEIISEEDDGFIIGVSLDNLKTLEEKINGFALEIRGTGKVADLWNILEGEREAWKPKHILSDQLFSIWPNFEDDQTYRVEVSIAFDKPLGKEPDPTKKGGRTKLERYRKNLEEREDKFFARENHFENFIKYYGEITSSIIHLEDSFACEVLINGKGLKDLVLTYPFVFEVTEVDELGVLDGLTTEGVTEQFEIMPPSIDSPEIGVIDSGIAENHKFIAPAIKNLKSKSYVVGDPSTADYVSGGGHGTRVAGAVLYPYGVSGIRGTYQLPCFIRNLRVLDRNNRLVNNYPAQLMRKIIMDNKEGCSIYNLSISSYSPFRKKHMSSWAAMLDTLIHSENILFLVAAGNVNKNSINLYLSAGANYPDYLHAPYCRVANPAQSLFAITVGSINHASFDDDLWNSLGDKDEISAFSRIGKGIWGSIKPDVVEYGGGLVASKFNGHVTSNPNTSPELIRATLQGGSAYGKDVEGTSFSTPKVAYIAAQLKKIYPNENANLLRALIVQGARLPYQFFQNPTTQSIQFFGYGQPSLGRVIKNSKHRVTFYNTALIRAEEGHLYLLKIPEEIQNPGNEYEILIEVTLAFTAKVRRTRQKMKSYLSTWLDWTNSKLGEPFEDFKNYVLKEIENDITDYDSDARKKLSNFNWKIKNRSHLGKVQDINRNDGTIQKDWAIIKSYQLPDEIGFAVRAHKGWDKNHYEIPYALTVSIEILSNDVSIYESIKIENETEIEFRI